MCFRSCYVTNKWMKTLPTDPQPPVLRKVHQRRSSALHNPIRIVVKDYTSVYKSKQFEHQYSPTFQENKTPNSECILTQIHPHCLLFSDDFQAWKANKRQPYKLHDSLKVNQGLVVPSSAYKEGHTLKSSVQVVANSKPLAQDQEPQPLESITSYRSDYVTHPVQARTRRGAPASQPDKARTIEPAVSLRPKVTWDMNQELFDEASVFLKKFKTWSLQTKFHGQGKAKKPSPPADYDNFLSTTHADCSAQKCQHTRPILPCMQTSETNKKPFHATTTMREDYKAWDSPRHFTTVHKEQLDRPKKTTFSTCTHNRADSGNTNPKPSSLHPRLNAEEKPQRPAEKGALSSFGSASTGNEEFRRYWTKSLDAGVTRPSGDIHGPATNQLHGF